MTAVRSARLVALVLVFVASCAMQVAHAAPEGNPLGLVIAYQTTPANRPALRQQMRDNELKQFESWKRDGALQDYRILFSRYVDSANWDMMALHCTRWLDSPWANPAPISLGTSPAL